MGDESVAIRWARDERDIGGAFALREAVFYGEQEVPPQEELDELDSDAQHLVALDADGLRVIGTLRLLAFGDEAKIGRVAVAADRRRRGIATNRSIGPIRDGRKMRASEREKWTDV
jgi:predicted GNAT family N-acyltransferase